MTTFLQFANESLLLSNLFLIIYKILLRFLNFWFPPVVNLGFFSKELLAPEPFEIPLYLTLSIIFVMVILSNSISFLTLGTSRKRWVYFLALLLAFYLNIGSYPLKNNPLFIKNLVDPTTSFLVLTVYLITFVIIIATVYKFRRRPILLTLLVILVIAFFTFEPGFPISTHDFSYFLGPIYEVAHGKTIFTTTSSQYGFLSILTLGFLTRINLFNPFYLPFLTWILYILQYFLCFDVIYKASKSIVFALIGLFSILTINYFSLYHLPNTVPQIGPMRWLPLIASLFFLQKYKKITEPKLIFLLSLLSLWNVEAGIALVLSYTFTLIILTIAGNISAKKVLKSLIYLVVNILLIFIIINIIHIISGRQMIDFIAAFARLREFAISGVTMIPMPWRTHFWLVLLIYFTSIIYFFRNCPSTLLGILSLSKEKLEIGNSENNLLLFSANLSLFASVYYIGRSHPHNLFHISIFFLLNVFLLINEIFRNHLLNHVLKKIPLTIIYLLLATFFIVIPAYNRKQALATMIIAKLSRLVSQPIFKPELEEKIKRYYFSESKLIKENLPDDEILILSMDDTYLFYLVDKKNLLLDNPQSGIASVSKADLNLALKKAYKICPQKIAAVCPLFGICPEYPTFNHEAINIQKVLLESREKSCKVEYKPLKCTNKLCIATAVHL